jgi:hypothetical protein
VLFLRALPCMSEAQQHGGVAAPRHHQPRLHLALHLIQLSLHSTITQYTHNHLSHTTCPPLQQQRTNQEEPLLTELTSRVQARHAPQCRLQLHTSPLPRPPPRPSTALSCHHFPPRPPYHLYHTCEEHRSAFPLRAGRNHPDSHPSKHAPAASAPTGRPKKPASTNALPRPLRWAADSSSPA